MAQIKNSLLDILNHPFKNLFDFLAPKYCLVCDRKIEQESNEHDFLCKSCFYNLPYIYNHIELLNRLVVKFGFENVYVDRLNSMLDIKNSDAHLNIIHSFKYQGLIESAFEFGKLLGKKLQKDGFDNYDAVIPLPVHHARKRERGYNQSDYIANGVAEMLNIDIEKNVVMRTKYTISQTRLNAEQRAKNLSDAFVAKDNANGKKYLIVDDVLTTGSTLNYCAYALKNAGADITDAATIAAR